MSSIGLLRAIVVCTALAALASCAAGPGMEGGIVGTGNQPGCDKTAGDSQAQADCKVAERNRTAR